ncbi:MAG: histidine kinase [Chitinophagaceae bacterium]|nr:histidine kinase [Chitinophagaceae bacterium]
MFLWRPNSAQYKRVAVLAEELEIERAINYFATSMVNQHTVDEILWDVTKNCIGRLKFVDCVVYLLDEERNILVQKAAYGPKNPRSYEIFHPIEIPIGKGIVGSVAKTGKAEIIRDTTKDNRYIKDDDMRLSEITVPIICDNKVIGIIDAEHPEKNFFKPRHLKILTKIAALSAGKINKVQIEEAYRQTEFKLIENNRKIAETKLLALRLQMNPHFIFNSLTAINNFILNNDAEHASGLLTKFSRFVRQVLDNSRTEWVSLQDELKALQIYIELEQLRFENKFELNIKVGPDVDREMVHVPPLIIQPYVENAIWHGLLHKKEGIAILSINCWKEEDRLYLQIEDNGIGRQASAKINKNNALTSHRSHGMKVTEERLQILNQVYNVEAVVSVVDLLLGDYQPAGTQVTLRMKIKRS